MFTGGGLWTLFSAVTLLQKIT